MSNFILPTKITAHVILKKVVATFGTKSPLRIVFSKKSITFVAMRAYVCAYIRIL